LSFVTFQIRDSWAMDAAKAPKCMRGGYEKVRPVSQKVRTRRPVP
jgi:hypothetical protein